MGKRIAYIVFAALIIISLGTGCGGNADGGANGDGTNALPDEDMADTDVEAKEASKDGSDGRQTGDEEKPGNEILHFIDAHGQEYDVEINPDIPKNEYDNAAFARDGDLLSYSDGKFTSRLGVDVSKHQGKIDWEKVAEDGFEFAFIRLGYRGYGKTGSMNLDDMFYENIEGAQAAGLDVGVYFFSQAINESEAKEEADFVIEHLSGYELQLPVVFDPESILDDDARTDDVSGEQFTKNTIVFCRAISDFGLEPMVYSNMVWEAFELDLTQLEGIPIWYADYEKYPQTPYEFSIWQYSNTGEVSGISGPVDLNIEFIL